MKNFYNAPVDDEASIIQAFSGMLLLFVVKFFLVFDFDNKGTLSADDFKLFFSRLNINFTADEVDDIIEELDVNHNGEIDYKFV
jgi:hypothetical protein